MSVLSELYSIFSAMQIPVETGVFSGKAPDEYIVVTPLVDSYELYADNRPGFETQEARLSLFSKGNYLQRKRQIKTALLDAEMTVTDSRYLGYEADTGYHHYGIDVLKQYELGG
jgi:hypothetical protein